MYAHPIRAGRYLEVPRTGGISTTELINRVAARLAVDFEEPDGAIPSQRQTVVAVVREESQLEEPMVPR